MTPSAPLSLRVRVAFLICALFLWMLVAGCSSPTAPSTAPAGVSGNRRLRAVTVSGPALPAILALPAEITRSTGLPAAYVGRTGGNMAFVVESAGENCALTTFDGMNGQEIVRTRHAFPSEAAMENLDETVTSGTSCNQRTNSALHEAGHGLGLDHPAPPCASEVMCTSGLRTNAREFGPGDLEALGRLYSGGL